MNGPLCVCRASCTEVGVRVSGTGLTDSSERLCGCWEPSLGPVPELPVPLTTAPSLQSFVFLFQGDSNACNSENAHVLN